MPPEKWPVKKSPVSFSKVKRVAKMETLGQIRKREDDSFEIASSKIFSI